MFDEFPQTLELGECGWQEQTGIGHQAVVVKDNAEYGIECSMVTFNKDSLFPSGFPFHNHYPGFREALSGSFKACPQGCTTVHSGLVDLSTFG